jgi:hypothetical protein
MQDQPKKQGKPVPFGVAVQNLAISNPHDVSTVYANHIGAGGTLTDFSLYFVEIGQMPGQKDSKMELKAAVTLPLALAEPLVQVLKQVIERQKMAIAQATVAGKASVKQ